MDMNKTITIFVFQGHLNEHVHRIKVIFVFSYRYSEIQDLFNEDLEWYDISHEIPINNYVTLLQNGCALFKVSNVHHMILFFKNICLFIVVMQTAGM